MIKSALVKLGLPASEESVREVLLRASGGGGPPAAGGATITFEQFCEWAVQRERQLLQTFRELDTEGYGFPTGGASGQQTWGCLCCLVVLRT